MSDWHDLERAKEFALKYHKDQKYGFNRPYYYHLSKVADIVKSYGIEAQIMAYLHDVVEDTEVTTEQVEEHFGSYIALCVGILTNELGANRKERVSKTYEKMSKIKGNLSMALIVKTADRLVNMQQSVEDKNENLLKMYRREYEAFKTAVYREGLCDELWQQLGECSPPIKGGASMSPILILLLAISRYSTDYIPSLSTILSSPN